MVALSERCELATFALEKPENLLSVGTASCVDCLVQRKEFYLAFMSPSRSRKGSYLGLSLQLWMRSMAPNKAAGKLAKALAAKTAAKTKAVKKEAKTPDRRKRVKGPAEAPPAKAPTSSASASPAEDHEVLGYPRGTVSNLLTSLKYQLVAKKTSSQQKADASEVLKEICLCRFCS